MNPANLGIPGMLGKSRSVKESTTITNNETAIVPTHPAFLPRQIRTAKTTVKPPKNDRVKIIGYCGLYEVQVFERKKQKSEENMNDADKYLCCS